jgi:hypothetical protein
MAARSVTLTDSPQPTSAPDSSAGSVGAVAMAAASEPIVRSLLGQISAHHREGGVLGIRARLDWGGGQPDFEFEGRAVHVVLCPSALAVRVALGQRTPGAWLVIVTDRTDSDLGLGITSRLAGRRLRSADPWEPVKVSFAANRIDYRLVGEARAGREVAVGLLLATPPDGWPAAPAGVLTADHAFGAVAARLGVEAAGPLGTGPVDALAILTWTATAGADRALSDLRARAGVALANAVATWCGERAGQLSKAWRSFLTDGRAADLVPLGLVLSAVVATPAGSGPRSLLRRELGGDLPTDTALLVWGADSQTVIQALLAHDDAAAARILARADALLDHLDAISSVDASDVLDRSLQDRCGALGRALHTAAAGAEHRASTAGVDSALIEAPALIEIELAWSAIARHALARRRSFTDRAEAGVRLARWLAAPVRDFPTVVDRHRRDDAWVDLASAAAWVGVADERLARGLGSVLAAVRLRRERHDRAFATALSAVHGHWNQPGIVPIEHLLTRHVLPLVGDNPAKNPVLFVLADGMSATNALQVTDDIVNSYDGWLEHVPQDLDAPLTAISALPSITNVSRTSLFCGEITSGDQSREQRGFDDLCRTHRISSAKLFHKQPLESSAAGSVLATEIAAAIDDTTGIPIVACVVNTIDDALDRSDPGGTSWTADTVKHLGPLLDRARRAGRIVVLTSDHGHVIERRDGRVAPGQLNKSNRWRPASGPPPGPHEVLVSGDRVDAEGQSSVVLAVDERLRYSAMKAGYHGGAAPAEVVIPVVMLAAGAPPRGWRLAPPQTPSWWLPARPGVGAGLAVASQLAAVPRSKGVGSDAPTLFDAAVEPVALTGDDLAARVITSAVYREQRKRSAKVNVSDDRVAGLIRACLLGERGAIDEVTASRQLDVALVQLAGAVGQLQRLLNVEQYPVLTRDSEHREVVVDEGLLREQFGLSP